MPMNQLKVKGLPAGWRILQFARATNDPSQGLVLCERTDGDEAEMPFVTWACNLTMGGCFHGHYFDDQRKAEGDFASRRMNLR